MREDKFNLCQILFNNKTSPEKTAIIYNYDNISYRELKNKICQYGTFFMKMHIRPNDTVAIYIEDSPESIYCFWGSILIGAHPVILNKKLEWSEVARICAGINVNVLIIDTDDNFTLPYTISIRNIKDALGESNYTMHLTAADKEIFTIFTSGSTGTPKRIEHSYADVVHCIESYGKKVLGITENDIFYSQSKLAFVFGLVSTLFLPFAVGATAILNHKDDIQEIGKISCQYRPTLFFAVPIIYKMLLKMEKTNSDNFSSVRAFVSSGETLPSCEVYKGIVTKEELACVAAMVKHPKPADPAKRKEKYLFSGKMRCGHCRRMMRIKTEYKIPKIRCRTTRTKGSECFVGVYSMEPIEKLVLQLIRQQAAMAEDTLKQLKEMNKTLDISKLRRKKDAYEGRLKNCRSKKMELYESFATGNLTKEGYLEQKGEISKKEEQYKAQAIELQEKIAEAEARKAKEENPDLKAFVKYKNLEALSYPIIQELIKEIRFYDPEHIEVIWNYQDDYMEAVQKNVG